MAKEKFLLVSLNEDKAKKLAQVISNETSRKILDDLAEKESTESELAEKLNIPISTVHYNLQALMDCGLIVAEEFHYSKKGKEILHYKLANKYIIIAPKTIHGIKTKLKSILPVALILAVVSGGIQIFSKLYQKGIYGFTQTFSKAAPVVERAMDEAASGRIMAAVPEAAMALEAPVANETAQQVIKTVVNQPSFWSNITLWFVIGAIFAIILFFIVETINSHSNK